MLAVAESLGLDVSRAIPRLVELLPAAATTITDRQASAVAEIIRAFTETRAGDGGDRDAASMNRSGKGQVVQLAAGSGKTEAIAQRIAAQLTADLGRSQVQVSEKLVRVAVRAALDEGQKGEGLYEDEAARTTTD